MGGLLALGAAATYMSQRAATELRVLQDDHLARQNAKCLGKEPELSAAGLIHTCEYPENQRSDGKTWEHTVAQAQSEAIQQRLH